MNTIEVGAQLFAYESRGRTLKPQQYAVGECLDRRAGLSAIMMSRRTAKTESVLLWTFAMMKQHDGLKVAFTMATTREAARAKFLADVLPIMQEVAEFSPEVHLLKGAGYERVDIGRSYFQVLAPTDAAFRSKEFDIIIVDESGHASPEFQDKVLPGMLPCLDTSEFAMLVLMGTAGEFTTGNLLHDALNDPDASVIDHSLRDSIDVEALADWDYTCQLLEQYHVGVGTLTTTDKLKKSWSLLKPEKFAREYLGMWGSAGGAGGVFDGDVWDGLYLPGPMPEPPKRFALAVSASADSAAIVAAWRVDGEARLLLVDHREGRAWLPVRARELARRYRVPVVVDPRASQIMADVKQELEQMRPAPRLAVQDYEDVAAAHERMLKEVAGHRVRHFGQEPLTVAFKGARRVQMGGKWKLGSLSGEDITPAQAAVLALRFFDAQPARSVGVMEPVAI